MRRYKFIKIALIILIILIIYIYINWQNNDIVISEYYYNDIKVLDAFNNYKILQISDLHNKKFGKDQTKLIEHIKSISPDIIVITGDLIDSRKTNIDTSLKFIKEAIKNFPIFYVSGNHEKRSGVYDLLIEKLEDLGVTVLENKSIKIKKDEAEINLIGVQDISFLGNESQLFLTIVTELSNKDCLNILLSHRPELLKTYADSSVDLVLTGHAHGGQIRLPFIGGLIAPNQGLFPKYTSGIHKKDNTTMIVSRGLGNSILPIRIFNRPELVVIYLGNN